VITSNIDVRVVGRKQVLLRCFGVLR